MVLNIGPAENLLDSKITGVPLIGIVMLKDIYSHIIIGY